MPRFVLLMLVAELGLTAGCRARVSPGGASGSKPDAARKEAESLAIAGATGAAKAQGELFIAAALPNGPTPPEPPGAPKSIVVLPSQSASADVRRPKSPPRAGPAPIIREPVGSSVPAPSEAEAEAQAVAAAQDIIERRLAELDPPVHYRPSENEVRTEFLRRDSRTVTPLKDARGPRADTMRKLLKDELGLSNDEIARRVDVEYDVEVTADQARHLRTRDRVGDALRLFGVFSVAALAGFLFLRADDWTKGYLTRWLAMAAVLLAGGTAAALYFV